MKSIYLFNGSEIPREVYEEAINNYPLSIPPYLLKNIDKISNKWVNKLISELSTIGETRIYINNTEYLLKDYFPKIQLIIVSKAIEYLGLRREEVMPHYERIIEEACDIIKYNREITNNTPQPLMLINKPLIMINRVIEELSRITAYKDNNTISLMIPNIIMKTELLENKLLIEAKPIRVETRLNKKAEITNYLNNVITMKLMP